MKWQKVLSPFAPIRLVASSDFMMGKMVGIAQCKWFCTATYNCWVLRDQCVTLEWVRFWYHPCVFIFFNSVRSRQMKLLYQFTSEEMVELVHVIWNYWTSSHQMASFNQFISDEIVESLQSVQVVYIRWNRSINSHQMDTSDLFLSRGHVWAVHIRWTSPSCSDHSTGKPLNEFTTIENTQAFCITWTRPSKAKHINRSEQFRSHQVKLLN
jgi:hypothetical protein